MGFNMSFYMVTDRPTKIANYSDLYNFYFKPRRINKVIFHLLESFKDSILKLLSLQTTVQSNKLDRPL